MILSMLKIGLDGYLLKYPPKTELKPHKDPINGRHYRLNIILKGSKDDEFKCEKVIFNLFNRIIWFRPDLYTHSVTIANRYRYVLSLGFAILK